MPRKYHLPIGGNPFLNSLEALNKAAPTGYDRWLVRDLYKDLPRDLREQQFEKDVLTKVKSGATNDTPSQQYDAAEILRYYDQIMPAIKRFGRCGKLTIKTSPEPLSEAVRLYIQYRGRQWAARMAEAEGCPTNNWFQSFGPGEQFEEPTDTSLRPVKRIRTRKPKNAEPITD